jgi:hypothetical protein
MTNLAGFHHWLAQEKRGLAEFEEWLRVVMSHPQSMLGASAA